MRREPLQLCIEDFAIYFKFEVLPFVSTNALFAANQRLGCVIDTIRTHSD